LGLRHIVITSVTRDDLEDGGAVYFSNTVRALRNINFEIVVEVLIPDFQGSTKALKTVLDSGVDILNHNLETVARLYPKVRPQAVYARSLKLLQKAKEITPRCITKSGLMLGLGEGKDEVIKAMSDLRNVSCDLLVLGQYLQPSKKHHPVFRYVSPVEFEELQIQGEKMGFKVVFSAPLARSSFHAEDMYEKV
jgi:lipoic acid synthetase